MIPRTENENSREENRTKRNLSGTSIEFSRASATALQGLGRVTSKARKAKVTRSNRVGCARKACAERAGTVARRGSNRCSATILPEPKITDNDFFENRLMPTWMIQADIPASALEAENTRLRRAVSDLTLDKMILAEAARGNF